MYVCMYVCMYVHPSNSLLGNSSVKRYHGNEYRRNTTRIVWRLIFCAIRVLSMESLWVCLCIPLSSLFNNSVKLFPHHWRIYGGINLYAVLVESKENNRLIFPRISCFCIVLIADPSLLHKSISDYHHFMLCLGEKHKSVFMSFFACWNLSWEALTCSKYSCTWNKNSSCLKYLSCHIPGYHLLLPFADW
jgi:hypothetical protein